MTKREASLEDRRSLQAVPAAHPLRHGKRRLSLPVAPSGTQSPLGAFARSRGAFSFNPTSSSMARQSQMRDNRKGEQSKGSIQGCLWCLKADRADCTWIFTIGAYFESIIPRNVVLNVSNHDFFSCRLLFNTCLLNVIWFYSYCLTTPVLSRTYVQGTFREEAMLSAICIWDSALFNSYIHQNPLSCHSRNQDINQNILIRLSDQHFPQQSDDHYSVHVVHQVRRTGLMYLIVCGFVWQVPSTTTQFLVQIRRLRVAKHLKYCRLETMGVLGTHGYQSCKAKRSMLRNSAKHHRHWAWTDATLCQGIAALHLEVGYVRATWDISECNASSRPHKPIKSMRNEIVHPHVLIIPWILCTFKL